MLSSTHAVGHGRRETGLSSSVKICNLNCCDLLKERDLAGNGAKVTDEVTQMPDGSPPSETLVLQSGDVNIQYGYLSCVRAAFFHTLLN